MGFCPLLCVGWGQYSSYLLGIKTTALIRPHKISAVVPTSILYLSMTCLLPVMKQKKIREKVWIVQLAIYIVYLGSESTPPCHYQHWVNSPASPRVKPQKQKMENIFYGILMKYFLVFQIFSRLLTISECVRNSAFVCTNQSLVLHQPSPAAAITPNVEDININSQYNIMKCLSIDTFSSFQQYVDIQCITFCHIRTHLTLNCFTPSILKLHIEQETERNGRYRSFSKTAKLLKSQFL